MDALGARKRPLPPWLECSCGVELERQSLAGRRMRRRKKGSLNATNYVNTCDIGHAVSLRGCNNPNSISYLSVILCWSGLIVRQPDDS